MKVVVEVEIEAMHAAKPAPHSPGDLHHHSLVNKQLKV